MSVGLRIGGIVAQLFQIHPSHPQRRLVDDAVGLLRTDGVLALPTDASYVLACRIENANGHERIRRIRQLDAQHLFSLLCSDFSQISQFAQMDNECFRLLKNLLPAPYTVVLRGSKNLGRRLLHPKRRTVGIRMPKHPVLLAILEALGEPLIATTLELPKATEPLSYAQDIREALQHQIDAVIDCGETRLSETTILDMTQSPYAVLRQGIAPAPW